MAQNTARKNSGALVPRRAGGQDGLGWWVEQYFQHAVTTSPASQQVQRRDLGLFLRYLQTEQGADRRLAWTPRLARPYKAWGYPYVPLCYSLVTAAIMVILLLYKPAYTVPGLGIVLLGIPVFYLWNRNRRKLTAGDSARVE